MASRACIIMSHQHYILWQIECNEIQSLEITKEVEDVFIGSDVRYDDIQTLLWAIVRNESITTIRFEGDFLDCLREDKRSEIIQAVGSYLPSLHEICLGDAPVLVSDLCHLVSRSKSLKKLHIHDLILQGTSDDFKAFETSLLFSKSIEEFEMKECTSDTLGIDLNKIKDSWMRKNAVNRVTPLQQQNYSRKRLSIAPRTA
jgi:hypothetical protein